MNSEIKKVTFLRNEKECKRLDDNIFMHTSSYYSKSSCPLSRVTFHLHCLNCIINMVATFRKTLNNANT